MIPAAWCTSAMNVAMFTNLATVARRFADGYADYEELRLAAIAYERSVGLVFHGHRTDMAVHMYLEDFHRRLTMTNPSTPPSTNPSSPQAPPTPQAPPVPTGNPPGTTPPERA